ncbi:MAG: helix-turn-helix transcriptional regulator [SAR324 cluster bacterium]|nr:helix-turn-helix transcriptional regulator [SAR324 cluster bacterium]MBF0350028.1 helix-turn-helix transcriptional regulator [SAR324 cluster bacterium]
MSQTAKLVDTLKKYLRARGITYKKLAGDLGLSEASVKRLFAEHSFSLKRLEEICKLIDLDFFELAKMSKLHDDGRTHSLTVEQERELADSPKLLVYLYMIIIGWSPKLIMEEFHITELELSKILLKLDKIGVLELHPGNKIKLLISDNVFWRKDGPIWNLYRPKIQQEFLDYPFNMSNERLVFIPGKLSEESIKIINQQIDKLVKMLKELNNNDSTHPPEDRHSTAFLIAFRPWVLSLLSSMKRRPAE